MYATFNLLRKRITLLLAQEILCQQWQSRCLGGRGIHIPSLLLRKMPSSIESWRDLRTGLSQMGVTNERMYVVCACTRSIAHAYDTKEYGIFSKA